MVEEVTIRKDVLWAAGGDVRVAFLMAYFDSVGDGRPTKDSPAKIAAETGASLGDVLVAMETLLEPRYKKKNKKKAPRPSVSHGFRRPEAPLTVIADTEAHISDLVKYLFALTGKKTIGERAAKRLDEKVSYVGNLGVELTAPSMTEEFEENRQLFAEWLTERWQYAVRERPGVLLPTFVDWTHAMMRPGSNWSWPAFLTRSGQNQKAQSSAPDATSNFIDPDAI